MKIQVLLATTIVVSSLFASPAIYASSASIHSPLHAMFAKEKMIKLSLRNDSNSSVDLKVGENVMTVAAGKTLSLNLPVGTRILANTSTPTHAAGSLIAEVTKQLNGATLSFK